MNSLFGASTAGVENSGISSTIPKGDYVIRPTKFMHEVNDQTGVETAAFICEVLEDLNGGGCEGATFYTRHFICHPTSEKAFKISMGQMAEWHRAAYGEDVTMSEGSFHGLCDHAVIAKVNFEAGKPRKDDPTKNYSDKNICTGFKPYSAAAVRQAAAPAAAAPAGKKPWER